MIRPDSSCRRRLAVFPVVEMLAGMAIAQAVAVIQVRLSNRELLAALEAAAAAGYLPVPNRHLWPELSALESAFHGGIFFTLSVGAGLSLLAALTGALAAAWKIRPAPLLLAWAGLVLYLNAEGFSPFPTLYALLVPPAPFAIARRCFREPGGAMWKELLLTRFLPIVLLALAWFTQYDRDLFIAIRDRLLLSHAAGRAVHDYYYRWTLYPAEAFKSLAQKQIRTVRLQKDSGGPPAAAVAAALILRDVLPVSANQSTHFDAILDRDRLHFRHGGRSLLDTPIRVFLERPDTVLQEFFQAADRLAAFRRIVFLSFLFGFPTALFLFSFAFLRLAVAPLLPTSRQAAALAALLCFVFAALAFVFFVRPGEKPEDEKTPPQEFARIFPSRRASFLSALIARGGEVTELPGWEDLAQSSDSRVRALLARGLGISRSPQAASVLTRLLADPQLSVRTAAVESLGRQGGPQAREALLLLLERSRTWYDQFYAYRTLRSLGWTQTAAF